MGIIMKVAIIENADDPSEAEFMTDKNGNRLLFESNYEADKYLMSNAEKFVSYQFFSNED